MLKNKNKNMTYALWMSVIMEMETNL